MANLIQKKVTASLWLLITCLLFSIPAHSSVEGFDYYTTSNYVEFGEACFHVGSDFYMYDYATGDYHNVVIENMSCYRSGCEIEVYDYRFGNYRYITLEGDVCD